ncbi:MAG TPA: fumarylacetoacetase [Terracidiphilus sp.]|nr:fumarylacetoacetase [Terracidiphilus sp.]
MIDWEEMAARGGSSWVESANDPEGGFPLDNLPYCVFTCRERRHPRPGVRIGNLILDLASASRSGILEALHPEVLAACDARTLNRLMACEPVAIGDLRERLQRLLHAKADQATRDAMGVLLSPVAEATLLKPVDPPDFTDFYASIDHATNVGRIFRPETPLLPNYKFVPIGYHGRASSIVVSGTDVRRPCGQARPAGGGVPAFGPAGSLDYEMEIGLYMGAGNRLGEPIDIARASEQIFGVSLVNDWSARDIQSWEYQPLGPFLGKSFATSVSPWVVPLAALKPFRAPAALRAAGDPDPLDYLWNSDDQHTGSIDLVVEAFVLTPTMRAAGAEPHRLSRANLRDLYWTPAQLIAHHSSNGCNLLPGDLLATGTISGPQPDSAGCLLELTHGGGKPVLLPNGEKRTALEDGDEIILGGYCRRDGYPKISLGVCRGAILPARGPSES